MTNSATSDQHDSGRLDVIAHDVERLDRQLNGYNGQEGFVHKLDRVLNWQSRTEGAEEAIADREERHHRENRFRMNLIVAIVSALAFYIALFKH